MITYPASLALSGAHLRYVADLIRAHRRVIGSPWRRLGPADQARLVLAYLRMNHTFAQLAGGFGIGTSTAWRYVQETVQLLAAQAPSLTQACRQLAWSGADYAFIDGTAVFIDRITGIPDQATTRDGTGTGRRRARAAAARDHRARQAGRTHRPPGAVAPRTTTDLNKLYYNGKHKRHAVVLQGLVDHRGNLVWISHTRPGSVHDLTHATESGLLQATGQAGLTILADLAYTGSGHHHVKTGYRRPKDGQLTPPYREANRTFNALRATAEHGFAPLKQWRILQRLRSSPTKAGPITKAIHTLMTRPPG